MPSTKRRSTFLLPRTSFSSSAPQPFTRMLHMGEVQAQVELVLVVLRLHVGTQLVKSLAVVLLTQMGQLVDHNHAQKLVGCLFEHRRNADLMLGRQPVALHARDRCVQDRKSTRLNSSHSSISYAVFC